jgi:2,3-bisphosphoglycerate-independent phosphoglycerate mutase
MNKKEPVVLCILDGWGIAPPSPHNAIFNAKPEFFNSLLQNYPHSKLFASEEEVGLPKGQMGNSEVGHMTIGSGRVIEQDLIRINRSISDGSFVKTEAITEFINNFDKEQHNCHLIGLISDGGVHSHIDHTLHIAKFLNSLRIRTHIHIICDGRDTLPKSSKGFISKIKKLIESHPYISIATLSGRFYSMDRDNRNERTEKALDAIIDGGNKTFVDPQDAISKSYEGKITDEFITPQSNKKFNGVQDGDSIIFTNFRADRMRQIVRSITTQKKIVLSHILTMTSYAEDLEKIAQPIFIRKPVERILSEVIASQGLAQLKIAETEKYAHVTFFLNSGRDLPYKKEDHILIDSPNIKTYDRKPEMSANQITSKLIHSIKEEKYDFIVVNYANADMVGHTGNYDATIKAIKYLDQCIEKLANIVTEKNGSLFITADHGNAEIMFDNKKKSPYTSHTLNPVPFICVNNNKRDTKMRDGTLSDIAPTILRALNLKVPRDMTGSCLIEEMHYEGQKER